ncbi:autoinducer binding domain-containing protein [Hyphomonas sp.]|uniref:autoinducer binding domain-containing protein n=1 Tax=Hyphomonas sp. TaxID=87 RepID=UPI00391CAC1D
MAQEDNDSRIERFRRELNAAKTLRQIQFAMEAYCDRVGILMLSYFHFPPIGAADFGPDITVYSFGFPPEWSARYRDEGLMQVDPLRRLATQRTLPFWWSQIESLIRVDSNERAYLERARKANLGDGLSIPVFGPNGRNGYYGAGFGDDPPHWNEPLITEIHATCQFAHLRFCDLILQALPESVTLSERERQILGKLVRGQSNQMIATELSISANTVDTYVRRCFDKLGVNDRMTAGLRGLALGLVD